MWPVGEATGGEGGKKEKSLKSSFAFTLLSMMPAHTYKVLDFSFSLSYAHMHLSSKERDLTGSITSFKITVTVIMQIPKKSWTIFLSNRMMFGLFYI